ncbi:LEAF RUST 10 DISEASE-RESISTANCE LOCUS RECEPTOR-LIKE PROTEIN KINASE-like 2.5 [Prunus avium]|uniref:non-specific serine/threonine protein kinase n=1 Tax=Prunus avium TaxID=42229 RepID=A0A6P5RU15_PRUAV|nr:LEAF RUST 10 DISEASE-RESISTANCE LOCUS RECEPTOR-LIKE PROTEIN KINASE-like 2.5 [Prunus avium]
MESLVLMFVYLLFISLPHPSMALSSCNGACATLDDCAGQLICINRKCNDNPDLNDFSQGGDGRGAAKCDEQYHLNIHERAVALSKDRINCSEAINCGGIGGISYPFWGGNRSSHCGLPGFEVQCLDNVPVISMSNINYRILKTNSSRVPPSVTVARQDYWKTICPPAFFNTSINFSLFNYPSSGFTNLTFYYGCNTSTSKTTPKLNSSSQVCSGSKTSYVTRLSLSNYTSSVVTNAAVSKCNSTTNSSQICGTASANMTASSVTPSPPADPVAPVACKNQVIVPVSTTAAVALKANRTTIQEAVDGGFELELKVRADNCNACVESGGKCGLNTTSGGFNCFCQDRAYATTCNTPKNTNPPPRPEGGSKAKYKIGISAGVSGILIIIACIVCISRKRMLGFCKKDIVDEFDVEEFIRNYECLTPKRYSYANVKKMTDNFKDKIGKGGFGTVYKGRLPDGLVVAVKVLSESKGNAEDFINEVASIGRTSHVNIVTLSGFCYERRDKRALIYEFMHNGSLDNFIHKQGSETANCRLEWKTLSEIAVGIARGLEYLHRGCNTRILHLDIKPQNILLDKNFCPKIADFGLAKLCKTKESIVSMMGLRGTAGYIAPEVFSRNFGGVSHKSDVYSYGMLVLEMVGARKNLDSGVSHTSEMFPHYIYKDLELDNDENAFGAITEEEKEIARKMVLISLWCIQTNPSDRPSMSKVVEMLEGPLHSLQIAPKPFLVSPTIAAAQGSMTASQQSEIEDISGNSEILAEL